MIRHHCRGCGRDALGSISDGRYIEATEPHREGCPTAETLERERARVLDWVALDEIAPRAVPVVEWFGEESATDGRARRARFYEEENERADFDQELRDLELARRMG